MNETTEYTFSNERLAHNARRQMIQSGREVSLLAYDSNRDLYCFDVYTNTKDN